MGCFVKMFYKCIYILYIIVFEILIYWMIIFGMYCMYCIIFDGMFKLLWIESDCKRGIFYLSFIVLL